MFKYVHVQIALLIGHVEAVLTSVGLLLCVGAEVLYKLFLRMVR